MTTAHIYVATVKLFNWTLRA